MEEVDGSWITNTRAAKMLGISKNSLRIATCYSHLTVKHFNLEIHYPRVEIEAILADPQRIHRVDNRDMISCRQNVQNAAETSEHLIRREEVAQILGITSGRVSNYSDTGRISIYIYKGRMKPQFFSYDEVIELAVRIKAKREATGWKKPAPLNRNRRYADEYYDHVEWKDFAEWERYRGEWLTVKQVAFMLEVGRSVVYGMIKSGRFNSELRLNDWGGLRKVHLIRKADVVALLEDPEYMKNSRIYCKHFRKEQIEGNSPIRVASREEGREIVREEDRWGASLKPQTSSYYLAINNPMNPPPEDYNCGFTIAPPCGW